MKTIDAYAHIGPPRYGSAEEALAHFDRWGIEAGNIVLGPGTPDLEGFSRLRARAPGRVRLFGIPFGETPDQRMELARIQVEFGISGMRFMAAELAPNRDIVALLGERGLSLLAINVYDLPESCRLLLDWLERHPRATVAAPHFLKPQPIATGARDPALFRALLAHPRFHVIFSRHGGTGSATGYPHPDLRAWVDDVLAAVGWERAMWGSEFPVLYQRDERVPDARDWIGALGLAPTTDQREAFYHRNAHRLFFASPPPGTGILPPLPAWWRAQYDAYAHGGATVPIFQFPGSKLDLPMPVYGRLLSAYLRETASDPTLPFGRYLARLLAEKWIDRERFGHADPRP